MEEMRRTLHVTGAGLVLITSVPQARGEERQGAKGALTACGSTSPEGLREILRILVALSFVAFRNA